MKTLMICCSALALIAGIFYFLIGTNLLIIPSLNQEDAPPIIAFIAGTCYIAGSLLILLKKRWLWITGIVLNFLVIAIFFLMYSQRPEIMFSVGGLSIKVTQILLEAGLIFLAVSFRKKHFAEAGRIQPGD